MSQGRPPPPLKGGKSSPQHPIVSEPRPFSFLQAWKGEDPGGQGLGAHHATLQTLLPYPPVFAGGHAARFHVHLVVCKALDWQFTQFGAG